MNTIMKNLLSHLKGVSLLAFLILLFIHCSNGENSQTEHLTPGGDPIPTDGIELIDFIVDKAAYRFSLNETDQLAVREILMDTYREKYGDLNTPIPPEEVRDMQRRVFMQSSDQIKDYMNTQQEKE